MLDEMSSLFIWLNNFMVYQIICSCDILWLQTWLVQLYGWLVVWLDGCIVVWLNGQMVGGLDGWRVVWLNGWMVGGLDGWMVRGLDGWRDGWLNGCMVGWFDYLKLVLQCFLLEKFSCKVQIKIQEWDQLRR